MIKNLRPLNIIFGYIVAFIAFAKAYNSWIEGRELSYYIYIIGGCLLLISYTTSLIIIIRNKRKNKNLNPSSNN
ncbi:hypothetical protein ATG71_2114 [Bacillus sp. es.034]|nr:hypothetical protein ATG71_2114 [Bacillus sp. es.034]